MASFVWRFERDRIVRKRFVHKCVHGDARGLSLSIVVTLTLRLRLRASACSSSASVAVAGSPTARRLISATAACSAARMDRAAFGKLLLHPAHDDDDRTVH